MILPIKAEIFNSMPFFNRSIRLLCNGFFIAYIIEQIINFKKGKFVNVNRHIWWLVAFLVCATISCFYNKEYDLSSNLKWVKWYAVFFSIFLTINNKVTLKDNVNTFLIVSDVIIAIGAIGCFWSLSQFATSYSNCIIIDGKTMPQGIVGNRLYGVYYNPNLYAIFAFVSIFLSCILFKFRKNKIAKFCYFISIICYYFILLLTGSRASLYSFMIVVGLISAFYCNRVIIKNKFSKIIFLLIAGILSVSLFFGISSIVKKGLFYLPYCYQKIVCYSKGDFATQQELVSQNPLERPAFTLSSRDIIWKEYLEIWKTSPWFGIGPENSVAIAKERLDNNALIVRREFAPHNEFLYLLVSVGMLGVIPFIVWFWGTIIDIVKFLYNNRNIDSSYWFLLRMITCIVVYFICSGIVENIVFRDGSSGTWFTYVFFFVLGNIVYLCNQDDKSL